MLGRRVKKIRDFLSNNILKQTACHKSQTFQWQKLSFIAHGDGSIPQYYLKGEKKKKKRREGEKVKSNSNAWSVIMLNQKLVIYLSHLWQTNNDRKRKHFCDCQNNIAVCSCQRK